MKKKVSKKEVKEEVKVSPHAFLEVTVSMKGQEFNYEFNLGNPDGFLFKSQQNHKEIGEKVIDGMSKALGVNLGNVS